MKRFFTFFLTLAILLSLAGLGWGDDIVAQNTSKNTSGFIRASEYYKVGAAFTCRVAGKKITSAVFSLKRNGSPGGTGIVRIYNATGTVGTNAYPTGAALAESGTINLDDINTTFEEKTFTFSGANQITLEDDHDYCIIIEVTTGDSSNNIQNESYSLSVTDNNGCWYNGSWGYDSGYIIYYKLYGVNATSLPEVTTQSVTVIAQTTATGNGTIVSDGGDTITENGVCIGASANPTIAGTHFNPSPADISGAFTVAMTGLSANTTYHARAFATNSTGTSYGDDVQFTTLRNPTTFYIGQGGTAATAAAATGNTTWDATKYMSPATHNALTSTGIIPGDTIYISDKGGSLVPPSPRGTSTQCLVPPISGTAANPITYAKAPGETPVIDMSYNSTKAQNTVDPSTGFWVDQGGGIYKTRVSLSAYARTIWEDGIALHKATDGDTSLISGDWVYDSGFIYYRPSTGTPAAHDLKWIWCVDAGFGPYAIDLRERSYIDVSGLTINYGTIGIGTTDTSSTTTLLTNINVHDCTFNYSPWAVFGQPRNTTNDVVFSTSNFYNNTFNYCNGGVSIWTSIATAHSNRPDTIKVYDNTFNNFASVDTRNLYDWSYAMDLTNDHEAISFQDAVGCEVTSNTITSSLPTLDVARRAIFFYQQPNAQANNNNIVAFNKITGGFDTAILFQGVIGDTVDSGGNKIYCNVIKNSLSTGTLAAGCVGICIYLPQNTSATMNYICNNTVYNNCVIANGESDGIYIYGANGSGTWTVANNIVTARRYCAGGSATTKSQLVWNNNNYYTGGFSYGGAVSWATWQGYGWDTDVLGSFNGVNPVLRVTDLAITTASPTAVKTGGAAISGITYSGATGLPGIDSQLYDVSNPSMGAYAEAGYTEGGGGLGIGLGVNGQMPPWMRRR